MGVFLLYNRKARTTWRFFCLLCSPNFNPLYLNVEFWSPKHYGIGSNPLGLTLAQLQTALFLLKTAQTQGFCH